MNDTPQTARALVAAISAALDDSDNEEAASLAQRGREFFPDAAVFYRLGGMTAFALGALPEAKRALADALTIDPLDHATILTLAHIAEADNDRYTAAEYLLTCWEHDPVNAALRAELTQRLAELYGSEGYLQYTRPALAALYARNAYPERATREYTAALAEQPARTDLRLAVALGLWQLGQLGEAETSCAALLVDHPTLVRAHWAMADALARQGKGEEARVYATRAAQLDPDGGIARTLIAQNANATIIDPDEPLRAPTPPTQTVPPTVPATPAMLHEDLQGMNRDTHRADDYQPIVVPEIIVPDIAAPEDIAVSVAPTILTHGHVPVSEPEPLPTDAASPQEADTDTRWDHLINGAASDALKSQEEADTDTQWNTAKPVVSVPEDANDGHGNSDDRSFDDTLAEPEPVIVSIAEDGEMLATLPGGEPQLDETDALPLPDMPDTHLPEQATESAAEPELLILATNATPALPTPEPSSPAQPALPATDPEWAHRLMDERLAASDPLGAIGYVRIALAEAGDDLNGVRALLPTVRALVVGAPDQPDARRLLGDTYSKLGQYAQAQGQYRQALVMRVAGRKARAD